MKHEFPVRDRSGTAGDSELRSPDGHLSPPPRNPRGLRAGTGRPDPTRDTPLRAWLNDLARRRCTITIENHVIHIRGAAARDNDRHHVNRHRHALELAAAGNHPAWWAHVLGRTDRLDPDDMPTIPDPRDTYGGTGWPCATCGAPADVLDHTLLPWCQEHA